LTAGGNLSPFKVVTIHVCKNGTVLRNSKESGEGTEKRRYERQKQGKMEKKQEERQERKVE
jgi:hypothetical protein